MAESVIYVLEVVEVEEEKSEHRFFARCEQRLPRQPVKSTLMQLIQINVVTR